MMCAQHPTNREEQETGLGQPAECARTSPFEPPSKMAKKGGGVGEIMHYHGNGIPRVRSSASGGNTHSTWLWDLAHDRTARDPRSRMAMLQLVPAEQAAQPARLTGLTASVSQSLHKFKPTREHGGDRRCKP
uniref:Uncharacterized protein n=1 Tax=Phlegmariurus squarrosus TaxID=73615 RepID=H9M837_PHLSQ|nr:hypothetical protein HusqMp30 [Phlegmariurus squarrosus]YP_006234354.1 hypothetical protein HusqMp114 [Phlegmariurus squarrosus]AEV55744.1 hypothetical protein HusqMp30 [Phlegmariurus squarrosus]AEV55795.1 hypothetical protein HusqMp114 [Phlegmariurus squarrosus]